MTTKDSHGFHGITFRDADYGWVIQLRLMGRYRVVRAFATSAEEAAKRHDFVLSKLFAFTEINAKPNFPEDFDSIDLTRNQNGDENYQNFFTAVSELFTILCKDATAAGMDVLS